MLIHDQAARAAKQAYKRAIADGARRRIAFDVACAAYRASHPELRDDALRSVVAKRLSISQRDMQEMERDGSALRIG